MIPAVIGTLAYVSLEYSDAAWSGAVGLVGGVIAAPGLLLAGAPFGDESSYLIAGVGSAVLWLIVGYAAARRATRNPLATWSDFWRHYLWLAGGIWLGSCLALAIATVMLGEDLI